MGINLKPVISLLLLIFLVACGNSKQLEVEKKSLQTENEALKTKVQQLTDENNKFKSELDSVKAELEDLKQTDQYLFSKAKEHFDSYNNGYNVSNLGASKDMMDKLLTRFPNSIYKPQASAILKDVNSKLAIIDMVENGESEIKSAISSHEFDKAWATLLSIKKHISADRYSVLNKAIDEEQNKPIDTTINRLISDYGNAKWKDIDKWENKRVRVYAYFRSIYRYEKKVKAQDKCVKGEEITVFYSGTNMEDYFIEHDPNCLGLGYDTGKYLIIGKLKFFSNGDLYIQAEKIEKE